MSIEIREARKEDMPAVLRLIKELAAYEKEPDAVSITSEILQKEGLGENRLFTCFVASVDNVVVGIALVYFKFSTWSGKGLYLEDLIVTQNMRGKGIGLKLFKRVMKFAKENDAKRVDWVVLDWNKPAVDFYEKSGANIYKDWFLAQIDEKGLSNY